MVALNATRGANKLYPLVSQEVVPMQESSKRVGLQVNVGRLCAGAVL